MTHTLRRKRAWIQVIKGGLRLGSHEMTAGDGVGITDASTLTLTATADVEALVFDLL